VSGFKPGSTLAPPAGAMTPDNKPAAPGLVEALRQIKSLTKTPWVGDEEREAAIIAILDAALSQPVPSAPEPSEREAQLLDVIRKIRMRLHFMNWPAESYWNTGSVEKPHWIPDWRYECQLIDNALFGSPIETPEKPTDTMPFNQLPSAPPVPATAPAVEPTELQRQVRDLTDTELGTLLTPYEAKNFSGLLKKVRALIDAALPASPEPATQGAAKPVHTYHPFQHWSSACPACVLETLPPVNNPATEGAASLTAAVLDDLAGDERQAFGFGAADFNDGVDAMLRAIKTWLASTAPEPLTPAAGVSEWISVKDRLPPPDERVLFVDHSGGAYITLGYKREDDTDSRWWRDILNTDREGDPTDCFGVTHWMPLPALPTEKQGD
jgi:hypothetical protein